VESISPITRVFQTNGSNPVKVLCENVNEYVCKYSRGNPASGLFIEYLAASFLKIWHLNVPEFAVVRILPEHIPAKYHSTTIQPHFFQVPCFGSKYYDFAKEIDPSITVIRNDRKIIRKIGQKEDLLSIGLFDLWMANEDRNHNNYNLLLNTDPEFRFIPIDHEKCFNSNSLTSQRGFAMLTEDETLFSTVLAKMVLGDVKDLQIQIDQVAANSYLWVADCRNSLENVINGMPDQWGIAKADKITLLNSTLFQQSWIENCVETFKDYTTRFLLPE
jgi:hypothetical protein